jgi:hypothetical protein
MSKRVEIIPVQVSPEQTVYVEAVILGGEEDVAFENLSLESVSDDIERIAEAVLKPIQEIKPKKATVEFGLQVGLESGGLTALWVKGVGSANLKVSLEWESSDEINLR